jgi:hypothetical protein
MTCPHLKEVTVVYCAACTVRKQVPVDRITTASRCAAESFRECPLYQEALARMRGAIDEDRSLQAGHDDGQLNAQGGTR